MNADTLFIVGGTRSGKSALALRWAESKARIRLFVATCDAKDPKTAARVARHKAERGAGLVLRGKFNRSPNNAAGCLCRPDRPYARRGCAGLRESVDCRSADHKTAPTRHPSSCGLPLSLKGCLPKELR